MHQNSYLDNLGMMVVLYIFIYIPAFVLTFLIRLNSTPNKSWKKVGFLFLEWSIIPAVGSLICSFFSDTRAIMTGLSFNLYASYQMFKAAKTADISSPELVPAVPPVLTKNEGVQISAGTPSEATTIQSNQMECPWCAEVILKKAKICKHCHKEVSSMDQTQPA